MDIHIHEILADTSDSKLEILQVITEAMGESDGINDCEPAKDFMLADEHLNKIREFAATLDKLNTQIEAAKKEMTEWIMANLDPKPMTLARLSYVRGYLKGERARKEKEKEKAAAAEVMDAEFINEESTDDVLTGPDFADNPAE